MKDSHGIRYIVHRSWTLHRRWKKWFPRRMTVSLDLLPLQNLWMDINLTELDCGRSASVHFAYLSHSAESRISASLILLFELEYMKRLQWKGWNSVAVMTSVSSSMFTGLMSTISVNHRWKEGLFTYEHRHKSKKMHAHWNFGHWYWDSTDWFANRRRRCMSPDLSWRRWNVYDKHVHLRRLYGVQQQWCSLGGPSEEVVDVTGSVEEVEGGHHHDDLIQKQYEATFQRLSKVWLFCLRGVVVV